MNTRNKSVADALAEYLRPTPLFGNDEFESNDKAKVVQKEEDSENEDFQQEEKSKFRIRNELLLDEVDSRYKGKITSRKTLDSSDDFSEPESVQSGGIENPDSEEHLFDSDIELSSSEKLRKKNQKKSYDLEADSEDQSNEENDDNEASEDQSNEENDDNEAEDVEEEEAEEDQENDSFQFVSKDSSSHREKGFAVKNQLRLWDFFLECRIQLQKCVLASNQMPPYDQFENVVSDQNENFASSIKQTQKNLHHLIDKLQKLQYVLLKSNPELESSKKRKLNYSDSEISDDECSDNQNATEEKSVKKITKNKKKKKFSLEEYSKHLEENHQDLKNYRNKVIQEWNDKTRLMVNNSSKRNFASFELPVTKQIENVLADMSRLRKRTQLKRSVYKILGRECHESSKNECDQSQNEDEDNEYDNEIFDDGDFYHQLLRELIDRKTNDIKDPIQLGRQWANLQKLRKKVKRKVDTRASKGRKIRYDVHPKLVNFLAPERESSWTEEAQTELYKSLFGKLS